MAGKSGFSRLPEVKFINQIKLNQCVNVWRGNDAFMQARNSIFLLQMEKRNDGSHILVCGTDIKLYRNTKIQKYF